MGVEAGELRGRRNAVVGEVRSQQVAVIVVAHLFEECLRDAGRDASVLLAFDEQRIEHRAAVVDGHMTQQPDGAGIGVDLDHRDVRAERERRAALVEDEVGREWFR